MQIIDGKRIALERRQELKRELARLRTAGERVPGLAVVLVGEDPASQVYVGHKEKAACDVGMHSRVIRLPATTSENEVLGLIDQLNVDPAIDGILVQLPLPRQINRFTVVNRLSPHKDVDGLGAFNQGLLALNLAGFVPCTPLGIMELLRSIDYQLEGKLAAVVGRSILVGAPLARLLTHAHASVLHVHSRTPEPATLCQQADVLVVAAGVHQLINETWIKEGAVVIDVGIHRIGSRLEGDVDFTRASAVAGYLTPVPGGVGPMTIVSLLANCLQAYRWQKEGGGGFGQRLRGG